ncbi:cell division protein FtsX [Roseobacter sp. HKCCD7870]|uniref:cell division protein FtsX n=1 Tax=Roseobacter sp. HKCCD7870 TaxID=3120343 RepID=UPI0030ECA44E
MLAVFFGDAASDRVVPSQARRHALQFLHLQRWPFWPYSLWPYPWRLEAEAPDAVLDNHDTWRTALISAAGRLRMMGYLALALIFAATVAMVSLAAQAALAANVQVIRVLRLVGARDAYIAGAFVRRFALRSLIGGGCGAALGIGALLVFPNQASAQSFMVGLSFSGLEWFLPLIIPVMIAFVSFQATKAAAFRTLRGMP